MDWQAVEARFRIIMLDLEQFRLHAEKLLQQVRNGTADISDLEHSLKIGAATLPGSTWRQARLEEWNEDLNFRKRVWMPFMKGLGLPQVTPHSARHCFISTMQSEGVEVALVAKLAGHANATITLSHYTQAVRGADGAVAALERAFRA